MMNETPIYDRIGTGYTRHRQADARLVDALIAQLGLPPGSTIADIGAGTGNYARALADHGFGITAIEPSGVMRAQAAAHPGVAWLSGRAEEIPLDDDSVDGAICILAMHHFASAAKAIGEMRRVARGRVVIFTFEPDVEFWLEEYFPEIFEEDRRIFPPIDQVAALFGDASDRVTIAPFMLPHDLHDCFLAVGWRRPAIYLDREVRNVMSTFAKADQALMELRAAKLREDLESGAWHERHGSLLGLEKFDAGYRFVTLSRA